MQDNGFIFIVILLQTHRAWMEIRLCKESVVAMTGEGTREAENTYSDGRIISIRLIFFGGLV